MAANTGLIKSYIFGLFIKALALNCCLAMTAFASEIYIYEDRFGQKLFSDHRLERSGYRLISHKDYNRQTTAVSTSKKNKKSKSTGLSKNLPPFKQRAKSFDQYIAGAAKSYDLDPALIKAVIHAESAFDPNATSHAGAEGLMQLMPATAKSHGVRDSFNARQNIMGGSRHLRYLMDKYNENTTLALAAYNAGEVPVRKYKGVPPYKETQNYVKKVIRLQKKYSKAQYLYAYLDR